MRFQGDPKLVVYLNDNLALMAGARALARRSARSNRRRDLGEVLTDLAVELETDLASAGKVMDRLSIRPSRIKVPAVRAGVLLGRLKLNGRVFTYSDLSRVVELEALCLLTASKQRFWESVAEANLEVPADVDPRALARQSGLQLSRLSELRREAARQALADPKGGPAG